ncbi:MAG: GNAT family N-acetyltransferase [Woeseiaceae bacterium]
MESDDGWILEESITSDIDRLMKWFPDAPSIRLWGGPKFRYPFTRHSFAQDMLWGRIASFSLRNSDGEFAAFGQLYERSGCINLARLVANPTMRGQGVGKRLVGMLMQIGQPMFPCQKYSLFVYRHNKPAYACYKSMGFIVTEFPEDEPLAEVCEYLTRPVEELEDRHAS